MGLQSMSSLGLNLTWNSRRNHPPSLCCFLSLGILADPSPAFLGWTSHPPSSWVLNSQLRACRKSVPKDSLSLSVLMWKHSPFRAPDLYPTTEARDFQKFFTLRPWKNIYLSESLGVTLKTLANMFKYAQCWEYFILKKDKERERKKNLYRLAIQYTCYLTSVKPCNSQE